MQTKPFISIIVPTYNRAKLIPKTLKSLQQQDYDYFEIIVVDDGSTDNTSEIVQALADSRTLYAPKNNAERAAARNFGARMAKGDYVNFFDSDDIALPNHLSEAAKLIQEKFKPEWIHLGFAWATPDGKILEKIDNFKGTELNNLLPHGNPLACGGVFIRKDIFLQNAFNEDRNLSASEDYELWIRLAAQFPLYYSNTITSWLVDHETRSVRTMNGTNQIRRIETLVEYIQKNELVKQKFRKDFDKLLAYSYSYLALHLAYLTKFKSSSLHYLFKAVYSSPEIIFNKRFYATFKNLILRWRK